MLSSDSFYIPDDWLGKTIAILGYSEEGQEYARLLSDRGIQVVIGLRPDDDAWQEAEKAGFHVKTLWEAVKSATVIQVW